ncbi:hypothetical protein DSCO28_50700 [Desulfosarcina ovata subsp. sediminis]|uniref:Uncharacterized protein n=1 Tax=Desulfosarcina ovata subsp. sediminis TaxID=885957 RepID=A0A5K7ZWE7_9BACT|nr:hypothetical protein [Desulfosarcina ovata]BBO84504.1 hypothetical protein DSCO28_50700 [Desulfosarcina ovata subsp. sediminis]
MRLKCPACRTSAGADAWAAEVHVEDALKLCLTLPSIIDDRILYYLALFRPRSGRPMNWLTTRNHIDSLKKLVDPVSINWNRQPGRENSPLAWAAAMDRAIAHPNLDLPLKDHNWLRKVAYGIAGEMARNRELLRMPEERGGHRRENPAPSRYNMPVCAACGMQANNIEKGAACPFCGKIA